MLLGVAPIAFLIPNSFVLSLTTKTIILLIPIMPAISVPIPMNVTTICKTDAKLLLFSSCSPVLLMYTPLLSSGEIFQKECPQTHSS